MTYLRLLLISKFTALLFILVPLSYATPPRTLHSEDHPIAVSQTHLYVMRHVSDNMGFYRAERAKTYILKLETKTSKLIEFHTLQDSLQGESDEYSKITANKDFNLFTYLEDEKAFQTGLLKPRPHQKITVEKKEGASLLSRNFSGQIEGEFHNGQEVSTVYDVNLQAMIKPTLSEILSNYIGPIVDPISNKEIYRSSQNFDTGSGGLCKITKAVKAPIPISKWTYKKPSNEFLIYVTCRSAGDRINVEAILPLALSFNPVK